MAEHVRDPGMLVSTRLPPERYLELLRADTSRLLEVGRLGLDAPVPSCPGWSVADLLDHTAKVFLHKVRCMRLRAAPPWPDPELEDREPLELLASAAEELLHELRTRGPAEPTYTWWDDEQSTGFWYRRMAQEAAVHRYDAERAHGVPTPIDAELAVDGIDEVLRLMLGGPWWEEAGDGTAHPVNATVRLEGGGRSWLTVVGPHSVTVTGERLEPLTADRQVSADLLQPALTVRGEPDAVLLWLWGRVPDDAIVLEGDPDVAAEFRARMAEATQ